MILANKEAKMKAYHRKHDISDKTWRLLESQYLLKINNLRHFLG